jgi:hypothetical protein
LWTVLLTIRMFSLPVLSSKIENICPSLTLYKAYIQELGDLHLLVNVCHIVVFVKAPLGF